MASATTEKDENAMASDVAAAGGDEEGEKPRGSAPSPKAPNDSRDPSSRDGEKTGFFHIYKSGHGYWTRMGTAGAAALIAALFANFLYHQLPVWIGATGTNPASAKTTTLYIIGGFIAGFALLVFWLMNKPSNADFLIATDSEMKKVNWTSKKELWGSTKIVIIFMFLIATMLFEFDLIFGEAFYYIGVLKTGPLPTDPQMLWVRWGFWSLVLLEITAIAFLSLRARSEHHR